MRKLFGLIFLLLIENQLFGQVMDLSSSIFALPEQNFVRFYYENDLIARTDEDYTQGFALEVTHGSLDSILVKWGFNAKRQTSLSLNHYVYTPENISSSLLQDMDRPYSANFQAGVRTVRYTTESKWRLSSFAFLGMQGPAALGKNIQTGIHQITGDPLPQGWGFQMRNELVAGYRFRPEYQIIQRKWMGVNVLSMLQLSILKSYASLGTELRLGTISDGQKGLKFCVYGKLFGHAKAYDATLQGSLLGKESAFSYDQKDLETLVGEMHVGAILRVENWQIGADFGMKTKEYVFGQIHRWGGIRLARLW